VASATEVDVVVVEAVSVIEEDEVVVEEVRMNHYIMLRYATTMRKRRSPSAVLMARRSARV
jgi:hypothetical protein